MHNSVAELHCTDYNDRPVLTHSAVSLASIPKDCSPLDRRIENTGDVRGMWQTKHQAHDAGNRLSFEMGPISDEGPSRDQPPIDFVHGTSPNHSVPIDDSATIAGQSHKSDFYAKHSCRNCNDHDALMNLSVSVGSIPSGCFFRRYCIDKIKYAEIPKKYWDYSVTKIAYTKLGDGSNGVVSISGPAQSGKTALLSAAMIRSIVFCSVRHLAGNRVERSHSFVAGPREFRSLATFYPENEDAQNMYDVHVLAIDDLDKIDPRHRGLVRDVIVHREQNGLQTYLSVTDNQCLREFDAQVYRRIENGTLLTLHHGSVLAVQSGLVLTG